ncbi:MAG: hypothetical protein R3C10_24880 [Pirellulales bacterium]
MAKSSRKLKRWGLVAWVVAASLMTCGAVLKTSEEIPERSACEFFSGTVESIPVRRTRRGRSYTTVTVRTDSDIRVLKSLHFAAQLRKLASGDRVTGRLRPLGIFSEPVDIVELTVNGREAFTYADFVEREENQRDTMGLIYGACILVVWFAIARDIWMWLLYPERI